MLRPCSVLGPHNWTSERPSGDPHVLPDDVQTGGWMGGFPFLEQAALLPIRFLESHDANFQVFSPISFKFLLLPVKLPVQVYFKPSHTLLMV